MMIKGLYETHLQVKDLDASVRFYTDVMGLSFCHSDAQRRAAFFWIGKPKQAMLGIWERPANEIAPRHFAFETSVSFILNEAADFLQNRGITPYNFLADGTHRPMVFAWMPALSIYFTDPDGHELEFIAILEGNGRPELGVLSYEDWMQAK